MPNGLGGILSQIANPQVANIAGRFQAGQLGAQAGLTGALQQQALVGALGQQRQKSEAAQRTEGFFDAMAAFSMSGDNRKRFLEQTAQKFASNPAMAEAIRKTAGLPEEKQNAFFLSLMELGQAKGIIPTAPTEKKTDIERRAVAAGLEPGTKKFQAFIREATLRPATQVTIGAEGKIPPGFRKTDTGSLELIPGSQQAMERLGQLERVRSSSKVGEQKLGNVLGSINEALENVDAFTTGIPGAITGAVPGTRSFNLTQTLDTVKANLGFDKLQEMRDMSPTGGALGQVSERELAQLERALTSLEKKQTEKQLKKNLSKAKRHYQNWFDNLIESNSRRTRLLGVGLGDIQLPEAPIVSQPEPAAGATGMESLSFEELNKLAR